MAREVQIVTWCDHHLAEQRAQVAATTIVGLDTSGARVEVDLCAVCLEQFVAPALNTFDTYGRMDKTQQKRTRRPHTPVPEGEGQCPECERVFTTKQSLGMHRARAHGWVSPNRKPA